MIDTIVAGRIHVTAEQRTSYRGSSYTTVQVLVDAHFKQRVLVKVMAFDSEAQTLLKGLVEHEGVVLIGSITLANEVDEKGQTKPVLQMVANRALTVQLLGRAQGAIEGSGQ